MMFRIFRHAAALAGCVFGLAVPYAHADDGAALAADTVPVAASRPPAAAGLYECQAGGAGAGAGAGAGTVFRSTPKEGCRLVAASDPGAPDPQRWLPLMGANGVISYFDQSTVRRQGTQVGVVVMRNAPAGVIRTASGDPIRSSLKRMVLNCATSMFAVVEQTLYSKRFARGDALYTIRAPQYGTFQLAGPGTIAGELLRKLCR